MPGIVETSSPVEERLITGKNTVEKPAAIIVMPALSITEELLRETESGDQESNTETDSGPF